MGTRAILIIDNDQAEGGNTFYAQYASPHYKITALTRYASELAKAEGVLSADSYQAHAATSEDDNFTERLDERLTMAQAIENYSDSDLEYIYWIGSIDTGKTVRGHLAIFHKEIGGREFKVMEGVTWTYWRGLHHVEAKELHHLAIKYLKTFDSYVIDKQDSRSMETHTGIVERIGWHAERMGEEAARALTSI